MGVILTFLSFSLVEKGIGKWVGIVNYHHADISKLHNVIGNTGDFYQLRLRVAATADWSSPRTVRLWAKLLWGQADTSCLLRKWKVATRNAKEDVNESIRQ